MRHATDPIFTKSGPWVSRHNEALATPTSNERSILSLIDAAADYAATYAVTYGQPIGNDGYAGPAWLDVCAGIRSLFSMDLGRLDGGTIDKVMCANIEEAELDPVDA
jgi:hypothetical protein